MVSESMNLFFFFFLVLFLFPVQLLLPFCYQERRIIISLSEDWQYTTYVVCPRRDQNNEWKIEL